jgi:hypothetical protein
MLSEMGKKLKPAENIQRPSPGNQNISLATRFAKIPSPQVIYASL